MEDPTSENHYSIPIKRAKERMEIMSGRGLEAVLQAADPSPTVAADDDDGTFAVISTILYFVNQFRAFSC